MNHYEDAEQMAVFEWAQYQPCGQGKISAYLVHVPNGGYREPREAARLKSLGVRAGVSDLFLALPRLTYHGLWIEMKRQQKQFKGPAATRSAVTPEQLDWIAAMQRQGYAACVCYGAEEAMKVLAGYATGNRIEFHRAYDFCLFRFHKSGVT